MLTQHIQSGNCVCHLVCCLKRMAGLACLLICLLPGLLVCLLVCLLGSCLAAGPARSEQHRIIHWPLALAAYCGFFCAVGFAVALVIRDAATSTQFWFRVSAMTKTTIAASTAWLLSMSCLGL